MSATNIEQLLTDERPKTARHLFTEMEAYQRQRDEAMRRLWEIEREIIRVKGEICDATTK